MPPGSPRCRQRARRWTWCTGTLYRRESRLAECWRDLQVVGQAVTLTPEWYPISGRVLLNLDPGPRLRSRRRVPRPELAHDRESRIAGGRSVRVGVGTDRGEPGLRLLQVQERTTGRTSLA
jgi:hypothetical protein